MIIRKSLLAVAALAALGITAASSTDASAKGKGGWKGGFHHHKQMHVGWRFHRGYRLGIYLPPYQECVKVITRRGVVKVVCTD